MTQKLQTRQTKRVTVAVYTDVLCPWCYVLGKRLRTLQESLPLNVVYRTFPVVPRREDATRRYGSESERRAALAAHLARVRGEPEASRINMNAALATPAMYSTPALVAAKAARRIAGEVGCVRFVDRAQAAWLEEGRDLNEQAILTEVAVEAGLDKDAFRFSCKDPAMLREVIADARDARKLGIHAAPALTVGDGAPLLGVPPLARLRALLLDRLQEV